MTADEVEKLAQRLRARRTWVASIRRKDSGFRQDPDDVAAADALMAQQHHIAALKGVLRYISSPTMSLPPGADAYDFASNGASNRDVRLALQTCIGMARAILEQARSTPSA